MILMSSVTDILTVKGFFLNSYIFANSSMPKWWGVMEWERKRVNGLISLFVKTLV